MPALLAGHIYPGFGFSSLGFWWSLTTAIRYVRAENIQMRTKQRKTPYRTSASMPMLFLPWLVCQHPCIETVLKLLASLAGILWHSIEVGQELDFQHKVANNSSMMMNDDHLAQAFQAINITNNVNGTNMSSISNFNMSVIITHRTKHHVAIYLGFFLGGLVELLIHWGVRFPRKLDRAVLILQFAIEWLIFSNHMHGRSIVDIQLHVLHAFTIFTIMFFCVLEAFDETQVLFTYGRALFTILQGTWFMQIGLRLYHPSTMWPTDDPAFVLNVTFAYCIHFFAILVFLFVEWAVVKAVIGEASWFHAANNSKSQDYIKFEHMSTKTQRTLKERVKGFVSDEGECLLFERNVGETK